MQVLLKSLKVMMVESNAHSDFIRVYQFNDSFTLSPLLRPVSWEEIESHKTPLVVLREIGFMHSMSTHGFMSGMCMKFLVNFSFWHVLPQNPLKLMILECNSQSEIIRVTNSTISIPYNSQSRRLVFMRSN